MASMKQSFGLRHALRDFALLVATLFPTLSACENSFGLELQADEQNARLAREKLWTDIQSGNKEAAEADSHAYAVARDKLLRDRQIPTPSEIRDEGFEHGGW